VRLGIVGSGMIVQDLLPILELIQEIEISAIFGRQSKVEKLEKLQKEYHIDKIYTDYQEMLSDLRINTIYIALPNHLHFLYAKLALEAGKHVICEKPFTSNLEELKILMSIAKENNLFLMEAITNQYRKNYLKIKELLPALGEIKIVELNYSQYSSRYDLFKEGHILPAFDSEMSGGALMDINSYNIHFTVGIFGQPKDIHYFPNLSNGIDTSGVLIMEYEDFKAVCIGSKDSMATSFANIQGENGTISVNGPSSIVESFTFRKSKSKFKNNIADDENVNYNTHPHRMYDEFKTFELLIREMNTAEMLKNLEHSLKVMEVMTIARKKANIIFSADLR